ncbi:MAG: class I SAM-dependent methyltransferase, partial [Myxococcota bacterium]
MPVSFTGERLHEGNELFGVDLARHRAAYCFAAERVAGGRVLDLGCGSGYGAAELARTAPGVVGLDRIPPDSYVREAPVRFVRGDLNGIPLSPSAFDLVVSFQVIEHLEDPTLYLDAMARMLKHEGLAIITTPNLLMSDRE